jgi:hypothetical protein
MEKVLNRHILLTQGYNSLRNANDGSLWEHMTNIKRSILKKWDVAVVPMKVCCIKFAQKVVQVQTPGPIADPRVSFSSDMQFSLCHILFVTTTYSSPYSGLTKMKRR